MNLPFTPEAFFDVFARYNTALWPMPIVLSAAGIGAVALLVLRPGPRSDRIVSAILALLWLWMGIAYHLAFFRAINPAAVTFGLVFVAQGLLFAWSGPLRGELHFRLDRGPRTWAALALAVYSLVVYEALGWFLGHRFPATPTFGLPCPTTIFTFGALLAVHRCQGRLLVIPVAWSLIGSMAAAQLGVLEDYGLPVAVIVALSVVIYDHTGRVVGHESVTHAHT
jgi:uncharacterized protein DUF6064